MKNTIEFSEYSLENLKKIAKENKRPHKTKQDLNDLAHEIANAAIQKISSESFENIFNLKK